MTQSIDGYTKAVKETMEALVRESGRHDRQEIFDRFKKEIYNLDQTKEDDNTEKRP